MLEIDGAQGEGGGQILRTALTLSVVTGRPCRLVRIRAGRKNPGLQRQHLTAVRAAAAVGAAEVRGDELASQTLEFHPRGIRPGFHHFDIGTAGSTGLVLQTILPPLLTASGPSEILLEGGTHNPAAPPFEFLAEAFVPLLRRMGPEVDLQLERHGFYPAGGGRLCVTVRPAERLHPLSLRQRGELTRVSARALVARLPRLVAERELRVLGRSLGLAARDLEVREAEGSPGPGNAVTVRVECAELTEVFTRFGQKGVPAEAVAEQAAEDTRRYLESGAAVGPHLADQLLLPLALAGGGVFRTVPLTGHATTNLAVLRQFLPLPFGVDALAGGTVEVRLGSGCGEPAAGGNP